MATMNKGFKFERFLKDVDHHAMQILMDNGIYRHIRFSKPDRIEHWFELVTTPGMLVIRGDMGTWAFSRVQDMFTFFRGDIGDINPDYWQEKLLTGRGESDHFDAEYFKERLLEWIEDIETPLRQSIADDLDYEIDWDSNNESLIRSQVMEYKDGEGSYPFQDSWEIKAREFDYHYLWCCHAIVWGIAQYDRWKRENGGLENA